MAADTTAADEVREDALESMASGLADLNRWLLATAIKGSLSKARRDEFLDRIRKLEANLEKL